MAVTSFTAVCRLRPDVDTDLTPLEREAILKAAQGLTAMEAENVFAKSLVEKRQSSLDDKSPFAGWENGIELSLHVDGPDEEAAAILPQRVAALGKRASGFPEKENVDVRGPGDRAHLGRNRNRRAGTSKPFETNARPQVGDAVRRRAGTEWSAA